MIPKGRETPTPGKSRARARGALFEEWLEKEHPAHSVWEHETQGAYESWRGMLRTAFDAGYDAHKKEDSE